MKESGINVNIFGPHSARSASTSKCKISGQASKKLLSQQDGRIKKHSQNFMISQLKGTFRTIYLNDICFFNICIYGVIYIETYMVLITL